MKNNSEKRLMGGLLLFVFFMMGVILGETLYVFKPPCSKFYIVLVIGIVTAVLASFRTSKLFSREKK